MNNFMVGTLQPLGDLNAYKQAIERHYFREAKFAYQYRVPGKNLWGHETPVPVRMILLIFQENHMDQGGLKI